MPRTDIHRPSRINTEDYMLIGFRYIGPATLSFGDDRAAIENHRQRTGGRYSGHEHGGTCHICGAHAHTLGVFWHKKTNEYIMAGEDCAAKMDMGGDIEFRSFKKRVAAGLEAARGKARAEKVLAEKNLSKAWEIYQSTVDQWEENTIRDIVRKLIQYGDISEKQTAFLAKLISRIPEREAAKTARAIANSSSQHVGTIGKREIFTLDLEWIKTFDNNGFGPMNIHGMRDAAGNIIIYKGSSVLGERGEKITIKATIKAHSERDGVKQTLICRPSNCTA